MEAGVNDNNGAKTNNRGENVVVNAPGVECSSIVEDVRSIDCTTRVNDSRKHENVVNAELRENDASGGCTCAFSCANASNLVINAWKSLHEHLDQRTGAEIAAFSRAARLELFRKGLAQITPERLVELADEFPFTDHQREDTIMRNFMRKWAPEELEEQEESEETSDNVQDDLDACEMLGINKEVIVEAVC